MWWQRWCPRALALPRVGFQRRRIHRTIAKIMMDHSRIPMEPGPRHLRAFLAVAEAGGFGAAARRLGCGQSTLSTLVRDLEAILGILCSAAPPGGWN